MKKKLVAGLSTALIMLFMVGMANATIINFDDIDAPSIFRDQTPLAEEYSSLGVHFSGSGEVLNFSSGFGVFIGAPFTSPNFLAFNSNVNAFPPETISFDYDISHFSLDFAGSIGTISLTGFKNGTFVDTVSVISRTLNSWSTISLSLSSVFDSVVFNVAGTDNTFVVDNLNFDAPSAVPEPATMLLFCTGIVGFAGSRFRRKLR